MAAASSDVSATCITDECPQPSLQPYGCLDRERDDSVRGGINIYSSLGDGRRYNPLTDSWATVSNIGAPSARTFTLPSGQAPR